MPNHATHLPPILRLPLELRQLIYAHLLPEKLTSHPLSGVGFTQVSHPPPSASLLNIHPQLTDEILEYFYTISTWTLIFSHAFNFFRIDPDLRGLERSYVLRRIRRLECIVFCDVLLLKDGASEGLESFCTALRRRVKRAVDVLMSAENLHSVTVSWLDSTSYDGERALEAKARILAPMRRLKGKGMPVHFRVGRVHGIGDEGDRGKFVELMRDVLGEARTGTGTGTGTGMGADGANETPAHEPAKLRMLVFDPKQICGKLNSERFARVVRGDAITGTGVWRTIPT